MAALVIFTKWYVNDTNLSVSLHNDLVYRANENLVKLLVFTHFFSIRTNRQFSKQDARDQHHANERFMYFTKTFAYIT